MRRRRFRPLHRDVGEVGVALGSEAGSWPLPTLVAALRRANAAGVDVFDLTRARPRAAAEVALAQAFPEERAQPVYVVPIDEGGGSNRGPRALRGPATASEWAEDLRRLGRDRVEIAMVTDPTEGSFATDPRLRETRAVVKAGEAGAWGVSWSRSATARASVPDALEAGASVLGVRSHLLDPGALDGIDERVGGRDVAVLVHDPFASGRLDGSLLREGPLNAAGAPRVTDIAELHRSYDAVTQLGFLTQERRRTLPQAALQVALRPTCVACVLVPLPTPDVLEDYTRLEKVPVLTDAEWAEWDNWSGNRAGRTSTSTGRS